MCARARSALHVRTQALALGIALQLTNILRDVGEDARRGRIYLPQEDLAQFGVTEEQVLAGRLDDNYVRMMQFQISRAREYFDKSEDGISKLSESARMCGAARCARRAARGAHERASGRAARAHARRARRSRAARAWRPAARRRPVRASLDLYRKILERIESNGYDNFRKRAYVSKLEKFMTLPSSYLKCMEAAKQAERSKKPL